MRVVPRTNIKKGGTFSPTRSRSLASATTVDTILSRRSSYKDFVDGTEDGSEHSSSGDGDFENGEERPTIRYAPSRPPGLISPPDVFSSVPKDRAMSQLAASRPPGLFAPPDIFSHVSKDSPPSNFLSTPAPHQQQDATRQFPHDSRASRLLVESTISSTAHHLSAAKSPSIFSTVPSAQERMEASVVPKPKQLRNTMQAVPGGCDKPLKVYMEHYDCEVPLLDPCMPAKKRLPDWFS